MSVHYPTTRPRDFLMVGGGRTQLILSPNPPQENLLVLWSKFKKNIYAHTPTTRKSLGLVVRKRKLSLPSQEENLMVIEKWMPLTLPG